MHVCVDSLSDRDVDPLSNLRLQVAATGGRNPKAGTSTGTKAPLSTESFKTTQESSSAQGGRQTVWGLQVGGRRLTADLKILTALQDDELRVYHNTSQALHVEPRCGACSLLSFE